MINECSKKYVPKRSRQAYSHVNLFMQENKGGHCMALRKYIKCKIVIREMFDMLSWDN